MIKEIHHKGKQLGIIIPDNFHEKGVHFCTPNNYSQQLAYMSHPKGKLIDAHVHNPISREVLYTQEVLVIKKGKLRVDFYDDERNYIESHILSAGDIILLASGGHGFEVLEELEMVEIKQGPYTGDKDKTRFPAVVNEKIRIVE